MIRLSSLEDFKTLIDVITRLDRGGILFGIIEGDTIIWTKKSEAFNLDILNVGNKLKSDSTTMIAIRDKQILNQKIPREVYGKRLSITSIPILNDEDEAYGALSIAVPYLHPVAASFHNFAPILAEMFHEGAFIYMTDLTQVAYKQPSQKFNMSTITIGYHLQEGDAAFKAIKTKQPAILQMDAEKYGVPVYIASFPLFDEENKDTVVATLGIVLPKQTAANLRSMSSNLEDGLTGISSAIEELAASATEIHSNEQTLNTTITDIISITDEINAVSAFIKKIADETKMLGLNASIEAARAGEAGRGFGVVANEINKLSDQSKSTVPKINKLTQDIKHKVEEASMKSKKSLDASQEQAAATEEITSSIEEITIMSSELGKIALNL